MFNIETVVSWLSPPSIVSSSYPSIIPNSTAKSSSKKFFQNDKIMLLAAQCHGGRLTFKLLLETSRERNSY